jgi:hypothetical protein
MACGVPIDTHLNHATSWFREERQAERRSTSLPLANHTRIDFFIDQKTGPAEINWVSLSK